MTKTAIKLTPQQEAAVVSRGGNLLVAAAAGSGKTKVLVERIMDRVCNEGLDITSLLMITYTRAAAAELRAKITAELSKRLAADPGNTHIQKQLRLVYAAQISTVHAFCGNLLRSYAATAGLPSDFRVGEEQECKTLKASAMENLLESIYKNIEKTPDIQAFIEELAFGRDDSAVPAILYDIYDTIQAHPWPEQWVDTCIAQMDVRKYTDAAETPWGLYTMSNIRQYVRAQMPLAKLAQTICGGDSALSDAYAGNLSDDIARMEKLASIDSWDALRLECAPGAWSRLGRMKKGASFNEADQEQIKALRDRYKKAIDSKLKSVDASSAEVLEDLGKTETSIRGMFALVAMFTERYAAKKQAHSVLDFNDLEHTTIRLLLDPVTKARTSAAESIAGMYDEIMVDEYQDSNAVQETIFAAISTGDNRFMVGDVKQSIYMFRLADPSIFLRHYNAYADYTEAGEGEARKILLSDNFRSRPDILSATNAVMSTCMSPQVGGVAYTDAEALSAGRTDFLPTANAAVELTAIDMSDAAVLSSDDNDEDTVAKADVEARYVARRIRTMLDGELMQDEDNGEMRPIKAQDIAILMRSTRNSAKHYIRALAELGIASKSSRAGSILDTTEVATLYCLLQVVDNPVQDIPLVSVLASPLFGFTADDLAQVKAADKKATSFYAALCACRETCKKSGQFLTTLDAARSMAPHTTLSTLFNSLLLSTDAEDVFGSMSGGDQRVANVHLFAEVIAGYEVNGARGLFEFICHIEAMREQGVELPQATTVAQEDAVSILSIHASKGLEYPIVFLSDTSRRFNQADLKSSALLHKDLGAGVQVLDKDLMCRYPTIARSAIASCKAAESKGEELRILYVAMTRAKQRLVITYCDKLNRTLPRLCSEALSSPLMPTTAQSVASPGEWVLLTALTRNDSAPLYLAAGVIPCAHPAPEYPWDIKVVQASDVGGITKTMAALETEDDAAPEEDLLTVTPYAPLDVEKLDADLAFVYPHKAATQTPAKVIPTQQDAKAKAITITRPNFVKTRTGFTAAERGTATHLFLRHANYAKCSHDAEAGIQSELARLQVKKLMTSDQAAAVSIPTLTKLFSSEVGNELATLPPAKTRREFPFSIMVDAKELLGPEAPEDKVLLQGIVDLFAEEADGLVLYDYKTDKVETAEDEADRAAAHKHQMDVYANALGRIFEKPVKGKYLVFLATGHKVAV